jgi:hypothetical protein
MNEMTKARVIPSPAQIARFQETYEEVTQSVPLIRERMQIAKLSQLAAKVGNDATQGAKLYTQRMTQMPALAAAPILAGIADKYFTLDASDEQIQTGEAQIRAAYAMRSISKDEMSQGLQYARSYKLNEDPDPIQSVIQMHLDTMEMHANEIPIISQLRGTLEKDQERAKILTTMSKNPYYAELYIAQALHNYGENGLSGCLDKIERDTGLAPRIMLSALTEYPGLSFATKTTIMGRIVRNWCRTVLAPIK